MNRIATIATIFSVAGLMSAADALADHRHSVDEMARDLQLHAARVSREVRYTFQRTEHYRSLNRGAYRMSSLAEHILELVHQGTAGRQHLAEDLQDLDAQFHQIEDAIERFKHVEPSGAHVHHSGRRFSFSVGVGYGQPNQYHLRRLVRELASMSQTLHALGDLFECVRKPNSVVPQAPLPVPEPAPVLPPTVAPVPPRSAVPSRSRGFRPIFRDRRGGFSFSLVFR